MVSQNNYTQHISGQFNAELEGVKTHMMEMAVQVAKQDTLVDKEYASAMRSLVTYMMEDPRVIGCVLNEMWALRS